MRKLSQKWKRHHVLSEEAHIGKRVRVRADHRNGLLRGRLGTIEKRWGDPTYVALDVLLEDGTKQLFQMARP